MNVTPISPSIRHNNAHDATGQHLGPPSVQNFWRRANERLNDNRVAVGRTGESETNKEPTIFAFGDAADPPVPDIAEGLLLPDLKECHRLIGRFFDFVSPTYRVLHRQTVEAWTASLLQHRDGIGPSSPIRSAEEAVVYMVLAAASVYHMDTIGGVHDSDPAEIQRSESLYRFADRLIRNERGQPGLASVQARFLLVQYLLSTSRPNQAWYVFGSVVQLATAVALHRKSSLKKDDCIAAECQKRLFWSIFTADKYINIMFGRPQMLRLEDIDQELPMLVNDEDITTSYANPNPRRDCLVSACLHHAGIARVVARACRELYTTDILTNAQLITNVHARLEEIRQWQNQLPPFLSGAINASSLIPIFQRQLNILRLAQSHAVMLISRPLLLRSNLKDLSLDQQRQYNAAILSCLAAAEQVCDFVNVSAQENQFFKAFWLTQYVAFNAISVAFIYLSERSKGNLPVNTSRPDAAFLSMVTTCQHHLAKATTDTAPSLRYSLVLEELRTHVTKNRRNSVTGPSRQNLSVGTAPVHHSAPVSTLNAAMSSGPSTFIDSSCVTSGLDMPPASVADMMEFSSFDPVLSTDWAGVEDFGLDPTFWLHLDSLPLNAR